MITPMIVKLTPRQPQLSCRLTIGFAVDYQGTILRLVATERGCLMYINHDESSLDSVYVKKFDNKMQI